MWNKVSGGNPYFGLSCEVTNWRRDCEMQTGECMFDMTNVKCEVDTHRPGDTQMDRDRINNFGYWKWTDEPARLHPERQIFGQQPNVFGGVIRSR